MLKNLLASVATLFAFSYFLALPVRADSVSVDFESYALGSINGQDGWTSLGSDGSGCAIYDHAVDTSFGVVGFGTKSLRISNAITSGCFGDQTFAKPLSDSVGETVSTAGSYSAGTKQTHFETQFDVASTMPNTQQPGLLVSVSPDRGDGSRMSYVGFSDVTGGINIIFYDVTGTTSPVNFDMTDLGTFDRSVKHTVKLTMDVVEGESNDVVKVWVDGVLKYTGTSWENYYRYDTEASAEQTPRIIKSVIFRTGGTAAPGTMDKGFIFDNFSASSSTPVSNPTDKSQCKNGGWMSFSSPSFKNQGDCVSYLQSNAKALGNKNK